MKRKLMISVMMVVMVVGLTGGVVMAQPNEPDRTGPLQGLASRIAAILGLDEQQVQDALDQARTEMKNEAMQSKLASLVEQGRLTQEQADEYARWYESRPPSIGPGLGGRKFGHHGRGFGRRFGGQRSWGPAPDAQTPTGNSI